MPNEIEVKMKVPGFDAVRQHLTAAGAKSLGSRLEVNAFFDTPGAALRKSDKGLRIRENRDLNSGRLSHVVTFKGPRQSGLVKTREEIEFEVGDPKSTAAVFAALGFGANLSFEKRRETWDFLHCKVELDEVPHLGTFVEIEGPDPDRILMVRQAIGLDDRELISASYASLLADYAASHGLDSRAIKFD